MAKSINNRTLRLRYYPNLFFIAFYGMFSAFFLIAFIKLMNEDIIFRIMIALTFFFLLNLFVQCFSCFGRVLILEYSDKGVVKITNKSFWGAEKKTLTISKINTIWVHKAKFSFFIISKDLLCTYSADRMKIKIAKLDYYKGTLSKKDIHEIINFFVIYNKQIAF